MGGLRETDDRVQVSRNRIRNARLDARFTPAGEIRSLTVDGEPLELAEPGNQIWLYPDHPHAYPAWDIDRGTLGNGRRIRTRAEVTVEEETPHRCVLAYSRMVSEKSRLTTRYILEVESAVLEMEWEFDWQDPEVLVKAVFPTGYNGRQARFGAPFGSVQRPQHPGDPRAEAMYEVPGSRWALLSDDGDTAGMALITEAKYGFSAQSGTIGLSLLRSAFVTDSQKHRAIRGLTNTSPYSDLGPHRIRSAVAACHPHLPREEQPAALAELLYARPFAVNGKGAASPFLGLEGGTSLIPVWVRPMEDGSFVVRLNETMGRRGRCRVRLAEGAEARIEDLAGRPMEDVSFRDNELAFRPYGLYGLRVYPAG
jgi:alpha-mannosidase